MSSRARKRILCIDRDSVSLQIRLAVLRTAGFNPVGHISVESGRRWMRGHPVDCVVVDENAVQSRHAAPAEITGAFPGCPILILSSGSPFSRPWVADAAGVRIFSKTEGPEAFLAAVGECVEANFKPGVVHAGQSEQAQTQND